MSDLQKLFDEDPLHLTKESLMQIVQYYREARKNFVLGDKKAGSTKKMKAGEKVDLDAILSDL